MAMSISFIALQLSHLYLHGQAILHDVHIRTFNCLLGNVVKCCSNISYNTYDTYGQSHIGNVKDTYY